MVAQRDSRSVARGEQRDVARTEGCRRGHPQARGSVRESTPGRRARVEAIGVGERSVVFGDSTEHVNARTVAVVLCRGGGEEPRRSRDVGNPLPSLAAGQVQGVRRAPRRAVATPSAQEPDAAGRESAARTLGGCGQLGQGRLFELDAVPTHEVRPRMGSVRVAPSGTDDTQGGRGCRREPLGFPELARRAPGLRPVPQDPGGGLRGVVLVEPTEEEQGSFAHPERSSAKGATRDLGQGVPDLVGRESRIAVRGRGARRQPDDEQEGAERAAPGTYLPPSESSPSVSHSSVSWAKAMRP